ncbi:Hypothetical predicted protein [Pelobates cultripes]|uniref:Uncharacterized protein n=1 Tax=Pelobates cultripes TaxID=61616 RepID=A0AAD1T539_PELCU|nr:Hypothetical predicted protein [Pelobates cultripes]
MGDLSSLRKEDPRYGTGTPFNCIGKFPHDHGGSLQRHLNPGKRTDHIETTLDKLHTAHNKMYLTSEHYKMLSKLTDVEDRYCHHNINNTPELISQSYLQNYLTSLLKALLPAMPNSDWLIDRAHLLPKYRNITDDTFTNVVVHLHEGQRSLNVSRTENVLDAGTLCKPFTVCGLIIRHHVENQEFAKVNTHRRKNAINCQWGYCT